MGVRTLIPEEEYLSTSFEHEPDYVDGEVVERGVPDNDHSSAQFEFGFILGSVANQFSLYVRPELRLRVRPGRYRIADVAVFAGQKPTGKVPTEIPLIVVEIVSPDDRHETLIQKLEDYSEYGIPHIWVVDPGLRRLYVFRDGALLPVAEFELPQYGLRIPLESLVK